MTAGGRRWLWACVAAFALGSILLLTLVPTSDPDTGTFNWCLLCGEFGLSDFVANVILFVPAAFALRFAGVPGRKTVASLLLLSVAIEVAQLWIPGRESTLGDIVSNTLGAAAGLGLAWWWPRRRRSALAAAAAAGSIAAVIAAIGVSLRPSLPATSYFGQWTPDLGMYEWYRGTVVSAELGGMALPSWRLADSRAVREHLLAGGPLRIRAVAGPPTGDLAPLFSIFDQEQREVLLVGPDRDDLVIHVRTRASDALLRQPELRWRGAMAAITAGDSLTLELRRTARGYCMTLNNRERCGLKPQVGEVWELLQPMPHAPQWVDATLDCVPLVLAGLLIGLLSPVRLWGYLAVGLVLASAIVLPPLVGLGGTPPLQLAALILATVAGGFVPAPSGGAQAAVAATLPQ